MIYNIFLNIVQVFKIGNTTILNKNAKRFLFKNFIIKTLNTYIYQIKDIVVLKWPGNSKKIWVG